MQTPAVSRARRAARWTGAVVAVSLAGAVAPTAPAPAAAQSSFPHEDHVRLFPLCAGCHEGIQRGVTAATYPEPALCGQCHDGRQQPRVSWSRPASEPGRFDHAGHARRAADAGVEAGCRDCHRVDGTGLRLVAEPARACADCHGAHHDPASRCLSCHESVARERHDRSAHQGCGGAGCHDADLAASLEPTRALCLVCHEALTDHEPGQRCAACHLVPMAAGRGSGG